MKYRTITREEFCNTPRTPRRDQFAGTFVAKADTLDLWPLAKGWVEDGRVLAAIIFRVSKRGIPIANLQLLHTFALYRRRGLAAGLVLRGYGEICETAQYFRVSSEAESVEFYRSLGLKFWGEQKSGSLLCMHKITSDNPADGAYVLDEVINAALNSGRRGCLVKSYKEPK